MKCRKTEWLHFSQTPPQHCGHCSAQHTAVFETWKYDLKIIVVSDKVKIRWTLKVYCRVTIWVVGKKWTTARKVGYNVVCFPKQFISHERDNVTFVGKFWWDVYNFLLIKVVLIGQFNFCIYFTFFFSLKAVFQFSITYYRLCLIYLCYKRFCWSGYGRLDDFFGMYIVIHETTNLKWSWDYINSWWKSKVFLI